MMLQKRVDYEFNGYHMPHVPRAARSARRRGTLMRKKDETQMCRFDLLANIAGKLLSESDSMDMGSKKHSETVCDSVKKEKQDEDKDVEASGFCGDTNRNFIVSDLVLGAPCLNGFPTELSCTQGDACSGPASAIIASECSGKVAPAEPLVNGEFIAGGNTDIELFGCRVTPGCKLECESITNNVAEVEKNGRESAVNKSEVVCNSEFPMTLDSKPSGLGCCDNSHRFSSSKDYVPSSPLSFSREDLSLVIRDDDEKLSWCTQPSTKNKAFRPSHRIGDRRIRKILASKYWNVTPNKNDEERLSSDAGRKNISQNGKNGSKLLRSQKDYPFKKRKLYDWSSVSNSDRGICSDGTCKSTNGKEFDGYASASMLPRANGTSTKSKSAEHVPFQSRNPHLKLKIRSFRVPELFIEISENATVGSLKKTVMESFTAILSSGLHVGVLLQGKKIRDDNRTLLQSGISHNNKLDALGFILEPNTTQTLQPSSLEDHPRLLPFDAPEPLSRYPPMSVASLNAELQGTSEAPPDPRGTYISNKSIESDHDSAPSPPYMSVEKTGVDPKALVSTPAMSVEALSVVPMRKSKRSSEAAQRRIRRPFSVSEVEELVQAVEKLGTGRWRDVKLCAFENAKHRTYVDLKDKWKTLVHTAKISPQQRRGEPVPQELLDRVLAAHAYWSHQQVKQQFKQEPDPNHVF